jgi:hypothetical protein
MWCRQCQQDVPAIAMSGEKKFCCPRCGGDVGVLCCSDSDTQTSTINSSTDSARSPEDFNFENWELDDQLRDIGRSLRIDKVWDRRNEKAYQHEVRRLDHTHGIVGPHHDTSSLPALQGNRPKTRGSAKGVSFLGILTWTALSLGSVALVCGGILLGWSTIAGRVELWNLGLPIAAGGQIALLLGLVLQLDRIWHDNRHTAAKLDEDLSDLKKTTKLLGTAQGPSSAFYTHLTGGANTHILLSDLKSQLDLLAIKISEQE